VVLTLLQHTLESAPGWRFLAVIGGATRRRAPRTQTMAKRASTAVLATSQHQRSGVRFESKQHAADGLEVSGMDTDVLADRMDIAERALDRAGGIERRCSTCEVNEVDCLHRASNRMPARQPYLHSLRNCRAMSREHVIPQPGGSVEQEEPRRTYEGFGLRQSSLGAAVFAQRLASPLVALSPRQVDQCLDCAPGNAKRDRAEPWSDAGMGRDLVA